MSSNLAPPYGVQPVARPEGQRGAGGPHGRSGKPGKGPPMLNAPRSVTALAGVLVVVHLIRWLGPEPLDVSLIQTFALIAVRDAHLSLASLVGLLGHMFLHANAMHLVVNALFLLAFGSPVQARLGTPRFLLFCLICGVLGGVAHLLLYPESDVPLVGASGAISGLMGGIVHFALGRGPGHRQRVLTFVAVWLGINLVVGLAGPGLFGMEGGRIAWEVHLGGFFAGLALFPLFDRGPRLPMWV